MIDDDADGLNQVVSPSDVVLSVDDSISSDRSIQSKTEENGVKKIDIDHDDSCYIEGKDDKDHVQAKVDYTTNEPVVITISNNNNNNNNYQANNNNNNNAYTNLPSHSSNTNEESIDQVIHRNAVDTDSTTTQSNANKWLWMERLGVTLLETVDRIGIIIVGYLSYLCHCIVYM